MKCSLNKCQKETDNSILCDDCFEIYVKVNITDVADRTLPRLNIFDWVKEQNATAKEQSECANCQTLEKEVDELQLDNKDLRESSGHREYNLMLRIERLEQQVETLKKSLQGNGLAR